MMSEGADLFVGSLGRFFCITGVWVVWLLISILWVCWQWKVSLDRRVYLCFDSIVGCQYFVGLIVVDFDFSVFVDFNFVGVWLWCVGSEGLM